MQVNQSTWPAEGTQKMLVSFFFCFVFNILSYSLPSCAQIIHSALFCWPTFIHIHSLSKCLLSVYYVSCPRPDTGYLVTNTKDKIPYPRYTCSNASCILQESLNAETEPHCTSLRWINTTAFATIILCYLGHQAISQ